MDANGHAIALLAVFPLGVALLGKFCFRPRTGREWLIGLLRGLGAFVVVMSVLFLRGISLCGTNPETQWYVPAIIAGMCAASARTWEIRFGLVVLFLVIAVLLGDQYRSLLNSTEEYAGLDDGHPFITCDKPVTAYKLWHSWFSGIYGLKPK